MRRPTPFQRGVLTGVALVGALCATALGATIGTAVALFAADDPDTED